MSLPVPPNSESSTTSISLLDRAKKGDEQSWQQLMAFCRPFVLRTCRSAKLPQNDTDDIVQETLLAVVRNIKDFGKEKPSDSFRAWITTITKNKIIDFQRRRARHPDGMGGSDAKMAIEQIPDGGWDEATSDQNADLQAGFLRQAIDFLRTQFEERTCQVFIRITVDGRLPSDVAHELSMSKAAVYQANSRTLRRLRQEFDGLIN